MILHLHPTANSIDPWRLPSLPLHCKGELPAHPGLYFAIKGDTLLYVGMSENICKRWKNHHEHANLKRVGGVRLHYLELRGWGRDRLLALESELIAKYCPRFNDVGVGRRVRGRDRRRSPQWWVGWFVFLALLGVGYQTYSPFREAVDELKQELND